MDSPGWRKPQYGSEPEQVAATYPLPPQHARALPEQVAPLPPRQKWLHAVVTEPMTARHVPRLLHRRAPPPPRRTDHQRRAFRRTVLYGELPKQPAPPVSPAFITQAADGRGRDPHKPNTIAGTPEPLAGFARMQHSVDSLFAKMPPETPLDGKWQRLSEWMDCYALDTGTERCSEVCGGVYEEADGSKREIVAACVVLEQLILLLLPQMPAIKSVLRKLRNTLFSAIYHNVPDDGVAEPPPIPSWPPTPETRAAAAGRFSDLVTHAERATQLSGIAVVGRGAGVRSEQRSWVRDAIGRSLRRWEGRLLRCILRGWREVPRRRRERRDERTRADELEAARAQASRRGEADMAEVCSELEEVRSQLSAAEERVAAQAETIREQEDQLERLSGAVEQLTKMTSEVGELNSAKDDEVGRRRAMERKYAALVELTERMIADASSGTGELAFKEANWGSLDILRGRATPKAVKQWLEAAAPGATASPRSQRQSAFGSESESAEEQRAPLLDTAPTARDFPGHALTAVGTLLREVAPTLTAAIGDGDEGLSSGQLDEAQAATVLCTLADIGVHVECDPCDVIGSRSTEALYAITALLFHRLADGGSARARGLGEWQQPVEHVPEDVPEDELALYAADDGAGDSVDPRLLHAAPDRIADRYDKVVTSARRWAAAGQSAVQCLVSHLLKRVLGGGDQPLSDQDQADRDELMGLQVECCPEAPEQDARAGEVLVGSYPDLRRVFRYYAAAMPPLGFSPAQYAMGPVEFWVFAADAGFTGKLGLPKRVVRDVLARVCGDSEAFTLNAVSWGRVLARLAVERYKEGSSPERIAQMLDQHVLAGCKQLHLDDLQKRIGGASVRRALTSLETPLLTVYRAYLGADGEMEKEGFERMIGDAKLQGRVSVKLSDQVFYKLHGSPPPLTLSYELFCLSVSALAAAVAAEPFTPLHQRTKHFIESTLLPPLARSLKLEEYLPKEPRDPPRDALGVEKVGRRASALSRGVGQPGGPRRQSKATRRASQRGSLFSPKAGGGRVRAKDRPTPPPEALEGFEAELLSEQELSEPEEAAAAAAPAPASPAVGQSD